MGDIHGRFDLLQALAAQITQDLAKGRPEHVLTIFLGDYIDRGPQSASVVAELSAGSFPTPIVALRGNHEEMFLQFLSTPDVLDSWRRYGALETLHSYGVDVAEAMRGAGYARARDALLQRLPSTHSEFLQSTKTHDSWGDYYFCHAGVKPHVALESQTGDDLYWIREEFLRYTGDFGKIVVHGHTPVAEPDIQANRINIDTGAFATSNLTALVLEGADRRFLSTRK